MAHSTPSTILVAVVAGVAGGGATALAFASREAAPLAVPTAVAIEARQEPSARPRAETRRQQGARAPAEPHALAEKEAAAELPAADAPTDLQEIARLEQERLREDLDAHASERIDAVWASATEPTLTDDARAVAADNGFEHVRTSCRSKTCLVTYRWPTRQDAEQTFGTTVLHEYQANCARTLTLPEGDPQPYEANLVLRCR
jgi:hypothetical protein